MRWKSEQGPAGSWEGQIAQFIKNDRIHLHELAGQVAGLALLLFPFELIDQVHGVVEADPFAVVDGRHTQGRGEVGLAGARAAHQDQIVGVVHEGGGGQLFDLCPGQRCFLPVDAEEVAVDGETGHLQLVSQTPRLAIRVFCAQQAVQPDLRLWRQTRCFGPKFVPGGGHTVEVQRLEACQAINGHSGSRAADGRSGCNPPGAPWPA